MSNVELTTTGVKWGFECHGGDEDAFMRAARILWPDHEERRKHVGVETDDDDPSIVYSVWFADINLSVIRELLLIAQKQTNATYRLTFDIIDPTCGGKTSRAAFRTYGYASITSNRTGSAKAHQTEATVCLRNDGVPDMLSRRIEQAVAILQGKERKDPGEE